MEKGTTTQSITTLRVVSLTTKKRITMAAQLMTRRKFTALLKTCIEEAGK
jgi:hypothetical protein